MGHKTHLNFGAIYFSPNSPTKSTYGGEWQPSADPPFSHLTPTKPPPPPKPPGHQQVPIVRLHGTAPGVLHPQDLRRIGGGSTNPRAVRRCDAQRKKTKERKPAPECLLATCAPSAAGVPHTPGAPRPCLGSQGHKVQSSWSCRREPCLMAPMGTGRNEEDKHSKARNLQIKSPNSAASALALDPSRPQPQNVRAKNQPLRDTKVKMERFEARSPSPASRKHPNWLETKALAWVSPMRNGAVVRGRS